MSNDMLLVCDIVLRMWLPLVVGMIVGNVMHGVEITLLLIGATMTSSFAIMIVVAMLVIPLVNLLIRIRERHIDKMIKILNESEGKK